MFKLPVCPHCGKVYTSAEVRKNMKDKIIKCKSCGKKLENKSFTPRIILTVIATVLLLSIYFLWLNFVPNPASTIILIFCAVIITVIVYYITPFFAKYDKYDEDDY